MTDFCVFETATGRIVKFGTTDTETSAFAQAAEGQSVLLQAGHDMEKYVVDGALADRPAIACQTDYQIPADGQTQVGFPLPEGTEIIFEDASYPLQTSFEFTSNRPGRFVFLFRPPFPYRETEVTIHAV